MKINVSAKTLKKLAAGAIGFAFLFTTVSEPYAQTNFWADRKAARSSTVYGRAVSESRTLLSSMSWPKESLNPVLGSYQLPASLGSVVETHAGVENAPVLLHFQDAHGVYGAQFNASLVLDGLSKAKWSGDGPLTVYQEGGVGPANVEWISSFPFDDIREKVGRAYLRRGDMTGEEYRTLAASEGMFRLVGVETENLYRQNLAARHETAKAREQADQTMAGLQTRLDVLKSKIYPPALLALDEPFQAYTKNKIGFVEYAEALARLSPNGLISRTSPHLDALLRLTRLEKTMDPRALTVERDILVTKLAGTLSEEAVKDLMGKAVAVKEGRSTQRTFYEGLLALADQLKETVPTREMRRYTDYLTLAENLRHPSLLTETENLRRELTNRFIPNAQVRYLANLDRRVALERLLWKQEMVPDQYAEFKKEGSLNWPDVVSYINSKESNLFPPLKKGGQGGFASDVTVASDVAVASGVAVASDVTVASHAVPSAVDLSWVNSLPQVLSYYALAVQRDEALVKNTLADMEKTGTRRAVLIAGGFHTPGLTQLFRDASVSYAVLQPNFDAPAPSDKDLLIAQEPNAFSHSVREKLGYVLPSYKVSLENNLSGRVVATLVGMATTRLVQPGSDQEIEAQIVSFIAQAKAAGHTDIQLDHVTVGGETPQLVVFGSIDGELVVMAQGLEKETFTFVGENFTSANESEFKSLDNKMGQLVDGSPLARFWPQLRKIREDALTGEALTSARTQAMDFADVLEEVSTPTSGPAADGAAVVDQTVDAIVSSANRLVNPPAQPTATVTPTSTPTKNPLAFWGPLVVLAVMVWPLQLGVAGVASYFTGLGAGYALLSSFFTAMATISFLLVPLALVVLVLMGPQASPLWSAGISKVQQYPWGRTLLAKYESLPNLKSAGQPQPATFAQWLTWAKKVTGFPTVVLWPVVAFVVFFRGLGGLLYGFAFKSTHNLYNIWTGASETVTMETTGVEQAYAGLVRVMNRWAGESVSKQIFAKSLTLTLLLPFDLVAKINQRLALWVFSTMSHTVGSGVVSAFVMTSSAAPVLVVALAGFLIYRIYRGYKRGQMLRPALLFGLGALALWIVFSVGDPLTFLASLDQLNFLNAALGSVNPDLLTAVQGAQVVAENSSPLATQWAHFVSAVVGMFSFNGLIGAMSLASLFVIKGMAKERQQRSPPRVDSLPNGIAGAVLNWFYRTFGWFVYAPSVASSVLTGNRADSFVFVKKLLGQTKSLVLVPVEIAFLLLLAVLVPSPIGHVISTIESDKGVMGLSTTITGAFGTDTGFDFNGVIGSLPRVGTGLTPREFTDYLTLKEAEEDLLSQTPTIANAEELKEIRAQLADYANRTSALGRLLAGLNLIGSAQARTNDDDVLAGLNDLRRGSSVAPVAKLVPTPRVQEVLAPTAKSAGVFLEDSLPPASRVSVPVEKGPSSRLDDRPAKGTSSPDATGVAEPVRVQTGEVTADGGLHLRIRPSASAPDVAKGFLIPEGREVVLTGERVRGWAKVRYTEGETSYSGWVSASPRYLKVSQETVRPASGAPTERIVSSLTPEKLAEGVVANPDVRALEAEIIKARQEAAQQYFKDNRFILDLTAGLRAYRYYVTTEKITETTTNKTTQTETKTTTEKTEEIHTKTTERVLPTFSSVDTYKVSDLTPLFGDLADLVREPIFGIPANQQTVTTEEKAKINALAFQLENNRKDIESANSVNGEPVTLEQIFANISAAMGDLRDYIRRVYNREVDLVNGDLGYFMYLDKMAREKHVTLQELLQGEVKVTDNVEIRKKIEETFGIQYTNESITQFNSEFSTRSEIGVVFTAGLAGTYKLWDSRRALQEQDTRFDQEIGTLLIERGKMEQILEVGQRLEDIVRCDAQIKDYETSLVRLEEGIAVAKAAGLEQADALQLLQLEREEEKSFMAQLELKKAKAWARVQRLHPGLQAEGRIAVDQNFVDEFYRKADVRSYADMELKVEGLLVQKAIARLEQGNVSRLDIQAFITTVGATLLGTQYGLALSFVSELFNPGRAGEKVTKEDLVTIQALHQKGVEQRQATEKNANLMEWRKAEAEAEAQRISLQKLTESLPRAEKAIADRVASVTEGLSLRTAILEGRMRLREAESAARVARRSADVYTETLSPIQVPAAYGPVGLVARAVLSPVEFAKGLLEGKTQIDYLLGRATVLSNPVMGLTFDFPNLVATGVSSTDPLVLMAQIRAEMNAKQSQSARASRSAGATRVSLSAYYSLTGTGVEKAFETSPESAVVALPVSFVLWNPAQPIEDSLATVSAGVDQIDIRIAQRDAEWKTIQQLYAMEAFEKEKLLLQGRIENLDAQIKLLESSESDEYFIQIQLLQDQRAQLSVSVAETDFKRDLIKNQIKTVLPRFEGLLPTLDPLQDFAFARFGGVFVKHVGDLVVPNDQGEQVLKGLAGDAQRIKEMSRNLETQEGRGRSRAVYERIRSTAEALSLEAVNTRLAGEKAKALAEQKTPNSNAVRKASQDLLESHQKLSERAYELFVLTSSLDIKTTTDNPEGKALMNAVKAMDSALMGRYGPHLEERKYILDVVSNLLTAELSGAWDPLVLQFDFFQLLENKESRGNALLSAGVSLALQPVLQTLENVVGRPLARNEAFSRSVAGQSLAKIFPFIGNAMEKEALGKKARINAQRAQSQADRAEALDEIAVRLAREELNAAHGLLKLTEKDLSTPIPTPSIEPIAVGEKLDVLKENLEGRQALLERHQQAQNAYEQARLKCWHLGVSGDPDTQGTSQKTGQSTAVPQNHEVLMQQYAVALARLQERSAQASAALWGIKGPDLTISANYNRTSETAVRLDLTVFTLGGARDERKAARAGTEVAEFALAVEQRRQAGILMSGLLAVEGERLKLDFVTTLRNQLDSMVNQRILSTPDVPWKEADLIQLNRDRAAMDRLFSDLQVSLAKASSDVDRVLGTSGKEGPSAVFFGSFPSELFQEAMSLRSAQTIDPNDPSLLEIQKRMEKNFEEAKVGFWERIPTSFTASVWQENEKLYGELTLKMRLWGAQTPSQEAAEWRGQELEAQRLMKIAELNEQLALAREQMIYESKRIHSLQVRLALVASQNVDNLLSRDVLTLPAKSPNVSKFFNDLLSLTLEMTEASTSLRQAYDVLQRYSIAPLPSLEDLVKMPPETQELLRQKTTARTPQFASLGVRPSSSDFFKDLSFLGAFPLMVRFSGGSVWGVVRSVGSFLTRRLLFLFPVGLLFVPVSASAATGGLDLAIQGAMSVVDSVSIVPGIVGVLWVVLILYKRWSEERKKRDESKKSIEDRTLDFLGTGPIRFPQQWWASLIKGVGVLFLPPFWKAWISRYFHKFLLISPVALAIFSFIVIYSFSFGWGPVGTGSILLLYIALFLLSLVPSFVQTWKEFVLPEYTTFGGHGVLGAYTAIKAIKEEEYRWEKSDNQMIRWQTELNQVTDDLNDLTSAPRLDLDADGIRIGGLQSRKEELEAQMRDNRVQHNRVAFDRVIQAIEDQLALGESSDIIVPPPTQPTNLRWSPSKVQDQKEARILMLKASLHIMRTFRDHPIPQGFRKARVARYFHNFLLGSQVAFAIIFVAFVIYTPSLWWGMASTILLPITYYIVAPVMMSIAFFLLALVASFSRGRWGRRLVRYLEFDLNGHKRVEFLPYVREFTENNGRPFTLAEVNPKISSDILSDMVKPMIFDNYRQPEEDKEEDIGVTVTAHPKSEEFKRNGVLLTAQGSFLEIDLINLPAGVSADGPSVIRRSLAEIAQGQHPTVRERLRKSLVDKLGLVSDKMFWRVQDSVFVEAQGPLSEDDLKAFETALGQRIFREKQALEANWRGQILLEVRRTKKGVEIFVATLTDPTNKEQGPTSVRQKWNDNDSQEWTDFQANVSQSLLSVGSSMVEIARNPKGKKDTLVVGLSENAGQELLPEMIQELDGQVTGPVTVRPTHTDNKVSEITVTFETNRRTPQPSKGVSKNQSGFVSIGSGETDKQLEDRIAWAMEEKWKTPFTVHVSREDPGNSKKVTVRVSPGPVSPSATPLGASPEQLFDQVFNMKTRLEDTWHADPDVWYAYRRQELEDLRHTMEATAGRDGKPSTYRQWYMMVGNTGNAALQKYEMEKMKELQKEADDMYGKGRVTFFYMNQSLRWFDTNQRTPAFLNKNRKNLIGQIKKNDFTIRMENNDRFHLRPNKGDVPGDFEYVLVNLQDDSKKGMSKTEANEYLYGILINEKNHAFYAGGFGKKLGNMDAISLMMMGYLNPVSYSDSNVNEHYTSPEDPLFPNPALMVGDFVGYYKDDIVVPLKDGRAVRFQKLKNGKVIVSKGTLGRNNKFKIVRKGKKEQIPNSFRISGRGEGRRPVDSERTRRLLRRSVVNESDYSERKMSLDDANKLLIDLISNSQNRGPRLIKYGVGELVEDRLIAAVDALILEDDKNPTYEGKVEVLVSALGHPENQAVVGFTPSILVGRSPNTRGGRMGDNQTSVLLEYLLSSRDTHMQFTSMLLTALNGRTSPMYGKLGARPGYAYSFYYGFLNAARALSHDWQEAVYSFTEALYGAYHTKLRVIKSTRSKVTNDQGKEVGRLTSTIQIQRGDDYDHLEVKMFTRPMRKNGQSVLDKDGQPVQEIVASTSLMGRDGKFLFDREFTWPMSEAMLTPEGYRKILRTIFATRDGVFSVGERELMTLEENWGRDFRWLMGDWQMAFYFSPSVYQEAIPWAHKFHLSNIFRRHLGDSSYAAFLFVLFLMAFSAGIFVADSPFLQGLLFWVAMFGIIGVNQFVFPIWFNILQETRVVDANSSTTSPSLGFLVNQNLPGPQDPTPWGERLSSLTLRLLGGTAVLGATWLATGSLSVAVPVAGLLVAFPPVLRLLSRYPLLSSFVMMMSLPFQTFAVSVVGTTGPLGVALTVLVVALMGLGLFWLHISSQIRTRRALYLWAVRVPSIVLVGVAKGLVFTIFSTLISMGAILARPTIAFESLRAQLANKSLPWATSSTSAFKEQNQKSLGESWNFYKQYSIVKTGFVMLFLLSLAVITGHTFFAMVGFTGALVIVASFLSGWVLSWMGGRPYRLVSGAEPNWLLRRHLFTGGFSLILAAVGMFLGDLTLGLLVLGSVSLWSKVAGRSPVRRLVLAPVAIALFVGSVYLLGVLGFLSVSWPTLSFGVGLWSGLSVLAQWQAMLVVVLGGLLMSLALFRRLRFPHPAAWRSIKVRWQAFALSALLALVPLWILNVEPEMARQRLEALKPPPAMVDLLGTFERSGSLSPGIPIAYLSRPGLPTGAPVPQYPTVLSSPDAQSTSPVLPPGRAVPLAKIPKRASLSMPHRTTPEEDRRAWHNYNKKNGIPEKAPPSKAFHQEPAVETAGIKTVPLSSQGSPLSFPLFEANGRVFTILDYKKTLGEMETSVTQWKGNLKGVGRRMLDTTGFMESLAMNFLEVQAKDPSHGWTVESYLNSLIPVYERAGYLYATGLDKEIARNSHWAWYKKFVREQTSDQENPEADTLNAIISLAMTQYAYENVLEGDRLPKRVEDLKAGGKVQRDATLALATTVMERWENIVTVQAEKFSLLPRSVGDWESHLVDGLDLEDEHEMVFAFGLLEKNALLGVPNLATRIPPEIRRIFAERRKNNHGQRGTPAEEAQRDVLDLFSLADSGYTNLTKKPVYDLSGSSGEGREVRNLSGPSAGDLATVGLRVARAMVDILRLAAPYPLVTQMLEEEPGVLEGYAVEWLVRLDNAKSWMEKQGKPFDANEEKLVWASFSRLLAGDENYWKEKFRKDPNDPYQGKDPQNIFKRTEGFLGEFLHPKVPLTPAQELELDTLADRLLFKPGTHWSSPISGRRAVALKVASTDAAWAVQQVDLARIFGPSLQTDQTVWQWIANYNEIIYNLGTNEFSKVPLPNVSGQFVLLRAKWNFFAVGDFWAHWKPRFKKANELLADETFVRTYLYTAAGGPSTFVLRMDEDFYRMSHGGSNLISDQMRNFVGALGLAEMLIVGESKFKDQGEASKALLNPGFLVGVYNAMVRWLEPRDQNFMAIPGASPYPELFALYTSPDGQGMLNQIVVDVLPFFLNEGFTGGNDQELVDRVTKEIAFWLNLRERDALAGDRVPSDQSSQFVPVLLDEDLVNGRHVLAEIRKLMPILSKQGFSYQFVPLLLDENLVVNGRHVSAEMRKLLLILSKQAYLGPDPIVNDMVRNALWMTAHSLGMIEGGRLADPAKEPTLFLSQVNVMRFFSVALVELLNGVLVPPSEDYELDDFGPEVLEFLDTLPLNNPVRVFLHTSTLNNRLPGSITDTDLLRQMDVLKRVNNVLHLADRATLSEADLTHLPMGLQSILRSQDDSLSKKVRVKEWLVKNANPSRSSPGAVAFPGPRNPYPNVAQFFREHRGEMEGVARIAVVRALEKRKERGVPPETWTSTEIEQSVSEIMEKIIPLLDQHYKAVEEAYYPGEVPLLLNQIQEEVSRETAQAQRNALENDTDFTDIQIGDGIGSRLSQPGDAVASLVLKTAGGPLPADPKKRRSHVLKGLNGVLRLDKTSSLATTDPQDQLGVLKRLIESSPVSDRKRAIKTFLVNHFSQDIRLPRTMVAEPKPMTSFQFVMGAYLQQLLGIEKWTLEWQSSDPRALSVSPGDLVESYYKARKFLAKSPEYKYRVRLEEALGAGLQAGRLKGVINGDMSNLAFTFAKVDFLAFSEGASSEWRDLFRRQGIETIDDFMKVYLEKRADLLKISDLVALLNDLEVKDPQGRAGVESNLIWLMVTDSRWTVEWLTTLSGHSLQVMADHLRLSGVRLTLASPTLLYEAMSRSLEGDTLTARLKMGTDGLNLRQAATMVIKEAYTFFGVILDNANPEHQEILDAYSSPVVRGKMTLEQLFNSILKAPIVRIPGQKENVFNPHEKLKEDLSRGSEEYMHLGETESINAGVKASFMARGYQLSRQLGVLNEREVVSSVVVKQLQDNVQRRTSDTENISRLVVASIVAILILLVFSVLRGFLRRILRRHERNPGASPVPELFLNLVAPSSSTRSSFSKPPSVGTLLFYLGSLVALSLIFFVKSPTTWEDLKKREGFFGNTLGRVEAILAPKPLDTDVLKIPKQPGRIPLSPNVPDAKVHVVDETQELVFYGQSSSPSGKGDSPKMETGRVEAYQIELDRGPGRDPLGVASINADGYLRFTPDTIGVDVLAAGASARLFFDPAERFALSMSNSSWSRQDPGANKNVLVFNAPLIRKADNKVVGNYHLTFHVLEAGAVTVDVRFKRKGETLSFPIWTSAVEFTFHRLNTERDNSDIREVRVHQEGQDVRVPLAGYAVNNEFFPSEPTLTTETKIVAEGENTKGTARVGTLARYTPTLSITGASFTLDSVPVELRISGRLTPTPPDKPGEPGRSTRYDNGYMGAFITDPVGADQVFQGQYQLRATHPSSPESDPVAPDPVVRPSPKTSLQVPAEAAEPLARGLTAMGVPAVAVSSRPGLTTATVVVTALASSFAGASFGAVGATTVAGVLPVLGTMVLTVLFVIVLWKGTFALWRILKRGAVVRAVVGVGSLFALRNLTSPLPPVSLARDGFPGLAKRLGLVFGMALVLVGAMSKRDLTGTEIPRLGWMGSLSSEGQHSLVKPVSQESQVPAIVVSTDDRGSINGNQVAVILDLVRDAGAVIGNKDVRLPIRLVVDGANLTEESQARHRVAFTSLLLQAGVPLGTINQLDTQVLGRTDSGFADKMKQLNQEHNSLSVVAPATDLDFWLKLDLPSLRLFALKVIGDVLSSQLEVTVYLTGQEAADALGHRTAKQDADGRVYMKVLKTPIASLSEQVRLAEVFNQNA